ncbi:Phosphoglycerol transferase MdoB [Roseovarius nanhaiticus]|uniref:Phosphoglycerol transferase MdoB n=1 Tax=Roseovarius nanhaiticus TaxID=573024 RepID=A0A1N7G1E1_9RHOB|nr:sulfatase-like hydrolase/transferase [Roseovarius nanhaiticus]SEK39840.1 Phosphoglycerol transferase MdoB [Roseovarius nanhaiticus]SIS06387.1 Phosphoglycerol transferase MdoB [Roseovarius nanhaiticus]
MTDWARPSVLRLILAAVILHLALIQPNHPAAMTWQALWLFPLELPVIMLALIALSGKWAMLLRVLLTACLTLVTVLKTADFGMFTALARGFNPVADLVLIDAGMRLLAGSIGMIPALLAALAAVLAVCAIGWLIWWATGVLAKVTLPRRRAAGAGAALFAVLAIAEIGMALGRWSLPVAPPGAAFTARVGYERVQLVRQTITDLRAFRIAARQDPFAERTGLLDRLTDESANAANRDVLVVFVESYGRTSLETPFYAGTHRATLLAAEARLRDAGYAMASGLLVAPTRGGQSWLSHATFANGLWINDQTRYGAMLASGRETLFHIAARSGFRTAAVMPQITLDWPESEAMGFDTVLAAADLGYRGAPFNWVTMPDQFTFTALDRLVRAREEGPVFAQLALGSSHAPWTPVPDLVPWDEVGDGRIFNDMAAAGDPPEMVWRDRDRVREQYRKAINYALRTVFDYAALHADAPPLMIILGDHQAADFVALEDRPDVPIHIIGPPDLVAQLKGWGWQEGLIPDPDVAPMAMDRMRDLLIETFTTPAALPPEVLPVSPREAVE